MRGSSAWLQARATGLDIPALDWPGTSWYVLSVAHLPYGTHKSQREALCRRSAHPQPWPGMVPNKPTPAHNGPAAACATTPGSNSRLSASWSSTPRLSGSPCRCLASSVSMAAQARRKARVATVLRAAKRPVVKAMLHQDPEHGPFRQENLVHTCSTDSMLSLLIAEVCCWRACQPPSSWPRCLPCIARHMAAQRIAMVWPPFLFCLQISSHSYFLACLKHRTNAHHTRKRPLVFVASPSCI
jgi:hypothetical protein